MKLLIFPLITLLFLFIFMKEAEAKILPQAQKGGQKVTAKKASGSTISVSPRMRGDRKALLVNFSNLQNASSVSYMLVYNTTTQQEGAMGAINLTGSSTTTQELLFGTCSRNVCRYHTNISNARLEISYSTKSGKKYLKKYKIKV